jgi:hypothetical protein
LHDDLILKIVWPHVLKVAPWRERNKLFQNLRICDKAWKKLVDSSGGWLHNKFYHFVLHLKQQDKQLKEQVGQKHIWDKDTFENYYMFNIDQHYNDIDIEQEVTNF